MAMVLNFLRSHKIYFGVFVFFLILGAAWGVWQKFSPRLVSHGISTEPNSAHFYQNQAISLKKIHLFLVYVVPKDRSGRSNLVWPGDISSVADKFQAFHTLQFRGSSALLYEIYPKPFILSHESIFYDTTNTADGNPAALNSVSTEIHQRILSTSGDSYSADAAQFMSASDSFPVVGLIYEGVGASGTKSALILSSSYFNNSVYESFRESLMYHEFGHALGLPDRYDPSNGAPSDNDIMGGGRYRPIEFSYLDSNLLAGLGINN